MFVVFVASTGKLAKLKAELREVEDGLVKALAGISLFIHSLLSCEHVGPSLHAYVWQLKIYGCLIQIGGPSVLVVFQL